MNRSPSPYLAGITMEEALERARHLNKEGLGTLLAPHWPFPRTPEDIDRTVSETDQLISSMGHRMIRGGVSLDPRNFGLMEGQKAARNRMEPLITRAEEYGYGVWLDVEDPEYVGAGLDLYLALRPRFPHLAVTLLARLSRSLADFEAVARVRGRIRLVKGLPAQDEGKPLPESEVSNRFGLLMERLFTESNFFAVATHDEDLIAQAERLMKAHSRMFEFQLYLGVSDQAARKLVYEGGHPVTIYLPFGEETSRHLDRLAAGGRLAKKNP